MKNGSGPVLMLRADMDGLPVVEQTGLPYASKARGTSRAGGETGIMRAGQVTLFVTATSKAT